MELRKKPYKLIVIGASAGGFRALHTIFSALPLDFSIPMVVVQHLSSDSGDLMVSLLRERCHINIKEAEDKDLIQPGMIYFAPPNYHLLVGVGELSLSADEKENFSRPSIDVLFESAADAYGRQLMGVILTGSNDDGARGMKKIQRRGGLLIAQDPASSEYSEMPKASIQNTTIDHILPLAEIGPFLVKCSRLTNTFI